MQTVAVIDYGMGNLHSMAKALEHQACADTRILVTDDQHAIMAADRVVLPGVGAIADCIKVIQNKGLDKVIYRIAETGKQPFLGVCIGLHALLAHSDENNGVTALGLLSGEAHHFGDVLPKTNPHLKVPHMGWNQVQQSNPVHPLWRHIHQGSHFYFAHSYYVQSQAPEQVLGTCFYGKTFACVLMSKNMVGVQFHPEKSAQHGLQFLRNFLTWQLD